MVYKYYDTPEGEDCAKKVLRTTYLSGALALGVATHDVLYYSHPQGYFQTLARYGYYTLPFLGMGAAFASTVCIATHIRKKDDRLNYFLGGNAAGAVFGAWRKSGYMGFLGAVALGFAAFLKKTSIIDGWKFVPGEDEDFRMEGSVRSVRHDFTLMKDPGLKN